MDTDIEAFCDVKTFYGYGYEASFGMGHRAEICVMRIAPFPLLSDTGFVTVAFLFPALRERCS